MISDNLAVLVALVVIILLILCILFGNMKNG